MATYDLEDTRTGLQISVDLDSDPTEEDVANIFSQLRQDGLDKVRQGPDFERDEAGNILRTPRGRRIKKKSRAYYAEHIPDALGIPRDSFNPDKGAPLRVRKNIDFFRQKTDQAAILKSEYGDENVTALNVNGNPTFLFKDKGEWRFVDPVGFDIGDVTADLAGDVAPTTAAIVAGVLALPSGPAGSALAAGAAEFSVGVAQDLAARSAFEDIDFDKYSVVDRAGQAALTSAVDYGTMKVGRLIPKGVFRKQGSDLATQELREIEGVLKGGVPQAMFKGEATIGKLKDIADKYPEGAIAKTFEDARQQIGKLVDDGVNPVGLSDEAARDILAKGLDNFVRQTGDEISAVNRTLDNLAAQKETLKLSKGSAKALEQKARAEAAEVFNKALEARVKNLRTQAYVSPEKTGKTLQGRLANQFVEREAQGNRLFEEAYGNLANSTTNAGRLGRIFERTKNDVILDIEDDVISKLAPSAAAGVDVTLKKLDEIADQSVTFKQLNEIIQLVEERTKRASATPGAQAGAYRRLGDQLRSERARLLRAADPKARASFANANRFFRDDILPNREGAVYNAIKAEAGDSYSKAIELAEKRMNFTLPRMVSGGTKVINDALSNPKAARDFLRAEGNTSEARKLLREQWLASKGLEAGKPIDPKSLKFSKLDLDIADVLWDKKLAGGFGRKRRDLEDIANFAASRGAAIDGIAADTLEKLVLTSDDAIAREMKKVAKDEIAAKDRLNKLTSQRFIKMMNKGELPLPSNQNGMEMFASGFLKSSPADIDTLMTKMAIEAPEMLPALKLSIYNDILFRAGRGTDDAQMGRLGYQLWNPEKLDDILRKEGPKIKKIVGKESFDQLDRMNKGLKRFAVARPSGEEEALKASAAASFGGISLFLSNISGNVKDRIISAAFASEAAIPFPIQKMLTADSYDKMMEVITRYLFAGSRGVQALLQQAEADPEFRKWLTETYTQLIETSEGK